MSRLSSHAIRRSRAGALIAILALLVVAASAGVAAAAENPDTVAKVTGGGTVLAQPLYSTSIASFGLNARRPVDFLPGTGGPAVGRIMYDRHRNSTGRHFDVPVVLMQAFVSSTPSPNGTGGTAAIVGNCMAIGATCPTGSGSAFVEVSDIPVPGGLQRR